MLINLDNSGTENGSENVTPAKVEEKSLDEILAGYKEKMEVPPSANGTVQNAVPFSAPQNPSVNGGPLPNPNNTPFSINRDTAANTYAPQEYYKRGAKKGQPKPLRKITTANGQQVYTAPPPQNNQLALSTLISGAMFITLIDLLIPLSIAGLNNLFNKDTKLEADKLKMTQSQRNDLSMVGEAVVRELKINAPHWVLMLIALFGIYGFNAVLLINSQKQLQAKKLKDEKATQGTNQNNSGQNTANNTPRNFH